MDTGKVIARQLSYCLRGAESDGDPAEIAQVQWWIQRIAELRKQQPPAESVEAPVEYRATGTDGR